MKKVTLIILLFSILNYFFSSSIEYKNVFETCSLTSFNHSSSHTTVKNSAKETNSNSVIPRLFIPENIEEEEEDRHRKTNISVLNFEYFFNTISFIYHSASNVSSFIYNELSQTSSDLLLILFQIFRL